MKSFWYLGVAVCIVEHSAWAQSDSAEARRLFLEGRASMSASRFADAVSAFERSLSLQETPATLYNLALAYRSTNRCTVGLNTLDRFDAMETDPTHREAASAIRRELVECVVTLTLHVQGQAETLFVDGRPSTLRDGQHRLLLDPGAHRLEVRRTGYRPVERVQEMLPGRAYEMSIDAAHDPLPAELIVDPGRGDAVVRVDDVAMVEVPGTVSTQPGLHRIRVVFPDGSSQERSVTVEPGGHVVVNFHERFVPSEQPLWSRWWFWTGLGVIVAGATVATVFALQPALESRPSATWGTTEFSIRIGP